jgi:N-acetylmuramic acid 6-phosphate etherase
MVRLHKVHGNLMVDLQATNAKLVQRAVRLTMHAAGVDEATARATLEQCQYRVKTAIVALLNRQTTEQAEAALTLAGGSVRAALESDRTN